MFGFFLKSESSIRFEKSSSRQCVIATCIAVFCKFSLLPLMYERFAWFYWLSGGCLVTMWWMLCSLFWGLKCFFAWVGVRGTLATCLEGMRVWDTCVYTGTMVDLNSAQSQCVFPIHFISHVILNTYISHIQTSYVYHYLIIIWFSISLNSSISHKYLSTQVSLTSVSQFKFPSTEVSLTSISQVKYLSQVSPNCSIVSRFNVRFYVPSRKFVELSPHVNSKKSNELRK